MPMLSLRKDALGRMRPCNMPARMALFGDREEMTALEALNEGVPIQDLLWVAAKMGRKDLCVRFSLLCAQRVAHLNKDPRVGVCLEVVGRWLENPNAVSSRDLHQARGDAAAAADAADAAYAAYAAYAAAYAADAYAADAAAYAAYAAAAYAAADAADAAYAARKAEQQAQREIFIGLFCAQ